jgi:hypothetical protein
MKCGRTTCCVLPLPPSSGYSINTVKHSRNVIGTIFSSQFRSSAWGMRILSIWLSRRAGGEGRVPY